MSDDLKQWSKLLQAIAKGVVIPIVGRDLVRIEVDGREHSGAMGFRPLYLPADFALAMPSRYLCWN
jgi:hypothetical protein